MFEMNIKGALKELKRLREDKIGYKAEYDLMMAAFEEANKDLIDHMEKIKEQSTTMKDIIRTNAQDHYNLNKNKQVCFGVKVKTNKNIIYDSEAALAWAEKSGIGLSLNKKVFESFAKSQEKDLKAVKLGFVTIEEKPAATIPTKIEVS